MTRIHTAFGEKKYSLRGVLTEFIEILKVS